MDQEPKPSPWRESERKLGDAEGRTARHRARCYAAKHAGAGVEGPDADRHANEDRECEASMNTSQENKPMAEDDE
ncbi:hypothetical protein [Bradyrhizobium sp. SBR1B]|uniref:hypothetical protein n=1 Tax=Bradyrhizobium sp. SBR1B TaxID=2663836 RepID=UPI001605F61F|nr:hypothetical protein [Bradyrhizobium sp. SBR1B]MBB4383344.1 hypothetical protein [Bradyrhizobium sp. SBR1B]